jgi:tetratricopeptide (TPR) repeat protein
MAIVATTRPGPAYAVQGKSPDASGFNTAMGRLWPGALLEVIRELLAERATGVLVLKREGQEMSLRIINGQVVSGSSGQPGRLGEILVRCGLLGRADLEAALVHAQENGCRLGPVLCEMGFVSRERLEDALRLQVGDVLYAGLFWPDGEWELKPDDATTPLPEDVTLRLSTAQLLLGAVRRIDDPVVVLRALGDLDLPLAAVAHPPLRLEGATLGPADAYVLSRVDGSMTARQILAISPLPTDDVASSLLAFLSAGIVERRRPSPRPVAATVPAPSSLGRDVEQAFFGLAAKSYFEVLGISSASAPDQVKAAYVALARKFHPDAVGDHETAAIEQKARAIFLRVSEAYQVLRGTSSRARYQEKLARFVAPMAAAPEPPLTEAQATEPPPLQDVSIVLREAEEHLAAGRPWEASVCLEEVLSRAKGPVRQRAHLLLARALAKTPSGTRRAEGELKTLLEEDPSCAEAYLGLGQLYRDKGFAGRAEAMFRHVLSLEPKNARALQELAALLPAGTGRGKGLLDVLKPQARR